MCGIAGCLNHKPSNIEISNCINSLRSRGPDDENFIQEANVSLVHTRLSILDTSIKGSQPMHDERKDVYIIYNGEIYNFQKLRDQNYFNKNIKNDTEIILRLYLKEGIKFISKLKGMFAFAIWDKRSNKLFLVRDRFGIKPLYKFYNNKKLFFGSEAKSIFALGVERKINFNSVKNYIRNGLLEDNQTTFFENINAIRPGTYEEYSSDGVKIINYWNLNENLSNKFEKILDLNELKQKVKTKINSSVKEHLISDVNLGVALSSGLDSQILLNILRENNVKTIKTFTYGFHESAYDESNLSSFKDFDVNIEQHISKISNRELIPKLHKAIKYFDAPLGGLGTLSFYNLMKIAKKENTSVILTGEGADEVFVGYKYYFYFYLKELIESKNYELIKSEVKNWNLSNNDNLEINNLNDIINKFTNNNIKAPDGSDLNDNDLEGDYLKENQLSKKHFMEKNLSFYDELRKKIVKDLFIHKIPKLLMFQDRSSMANGVETRVPFLDHELIEGIFSLNSNNLIKDGNLKFLLRQIYKDKLITNTSEEKKYVATPQREWLKNENFDEIYDIINNGVLKKNKIINFNNFQSKYIKYKESKELGNSFFVWKILNLELMLEHDI